MPEDMLIPERSSSQIDQDRVRTRTQVQQLGAPRPGFKPNPDLYDVLVARHAEIDGKLRFESVPTQAGEDALVVFGQLFIPDNQRFPEARDELIELGFQPNDPRCVALRERFDPPKSAIDVRAFTYVGADDDAPSAVAAALSSLNDPDRNPDDDPNNQIFAARTMVSALQMVVKSSDGPAPTSVAVAPFREALTFKDDEVKIAVIDTGIVKEPRGDGWLNEVLRDDDDPNDPTDPYNIDKLDVFPCYDRLDFGAGHGTFVAGIIRQVDPQANIVVYRALDTDGIASEEDVACAMLQAAADGADVINLSVGMEAVDEAHPCPTLQVAVDQILAMPHAPAIVASAGNNGTTQRVYPAALPGVVSVAALRAVKDSHDPYCDPLPEGADWSSHGNWVRCSAVGEGIVSTFVEGEEDSFVKDEDGNAIHCGEDDLAHGGRPRDVYGPDAWAVWTGTSFAAPQIAALIARKYRENRDSGLGGTPLDAAEALFPQSGVREDGYGQRVVVLRGTRPARRPGA